jgi:ribosomal protein S1
MFLNSLRLGEVRTGTVADVREFGVFVHLDGEPAEVCTGFIRVPDLSWAHFDHPAEVVAVGQRVTVAVINVDTDREQVAVSLKALGGSLLGRTDGDHAD